MLSNPLKCGKCVTLRRVGASIECTCLIHAAGSLNDAEKVPESFARTVESCRVEWECLRIGKQRIACLRFIKE